MSRPLPPLDRDDICRRYEAGETTYQIARSLDISPNSVQRILAAMGVVRRQGGAPPFPHDIRALHARYVSGESSEAIAKGLGYSDGSVVRGAFYRQGLPVRSRSDARRLEMGGLSPQQRLGRTAAAHAAVRGMTHSFDQLCRRALGVEASQGHVSETDRAMGVMLTGLGADVSYAKAIGPYNADITVGGVVVECYGGGWHGGGRAMARFDKRTRHILDAGWHLVVVWAEKPRYPLGISAAEYVVTLEDKASRDPSAPRQYRVIRGTGQELIRGCSKDNDFPVKLPRKRVGHIWCEHNR